MNKVAMRFQIGKAGVTEGILESLNNAFKTHYQIRISVLKAARSRKEMMTKIADELVKGLERPTQYRIIGFTIILNKSKRR
jgi:RNA-binding protein YhbY